MSLQLSEQQKTRIEANRLKALKRRQEKKLNHPYSREASSSGGVRTVSAVTRSNKLVSDDHSVSKKIIDSGAGFFIEEEEGQPSATKIDPATVIYPDGPTSIDQIQCNVCQKEFFDSYLWKNFSLETCDECRDCDDTHELMTKTDAKKIYLLKDSDLDLREPLLRYIVKKNPHNKRWGDMKLYLRCQVEARAMEIWGSEEAIEQHRDEKTKNLEKAKQKKFDKKVKELRMAVRSSLWTKDTRSHQHEFGEELYNEDDDTWSKTCVECKHTMTYEKM